MMKLHPQIAGRSCSEADSVSTRKSKVILTRAVMAEMLESRTMLSIDTTSWKAPNLVVGNHWIYNITPEPGQTATSESTVVGPATFRGASAVQIAGSITYQGKTTQNKGYVGTDVNGEFVNYGGVNEGDIQVDTTVFDPFEPTFPNTMEAGHVYHFDSNFAIESQTVATGATDTTRYSEAVDFTLVSETPTLLSLPYGSVSAYEIQTTTSTLQEGVTDPDVSSESIFYAPQLGMVKKLPSASDGTTWELAQFNPSDAHLEFSQQPTDVNIKKPLTPPVIVSVIDANGVLDTNKSGTVTLSLNAFANSGTGRLGGTLTRPIVGGIATFNNLTISTKGVYQLKATDSAGDDIGLSNRFKVGFKSLKLEINSRPKGIPKGVATGDNVFYGLYVNKLIVPAPLPVVSETIVQTLPDGIVPLDISAGGTFSGHTITWNIGAAPVANFRIVVPDARTLNGLTSINSSAEYKRTYSDGTFDTATATHTLKLDINYEVKGSIYEAQFIFPAKNIVSVSSPAKSVLVDLVNSEGAIVATGAVKSNGTFSIKAPKEGTYTLTADILVDSYATSTNAIAKRHVYAGKSVELLKSNTKPLDMGKLYLSASLFDTASKTLNRLNNYTTSKFQYLETFREPLFRFDTSSAETMLNTLAGTLTAPSPFMNGSAINSTGTHDKWIGAMRAIAGLASIDKRFYDMFKLTDQAGKTVSVILSVQMTIGLGKMAFNYNKKLQGLVKGTSLEGKIPKWMLTPSSKSVDELLRNGTRVAGMTALGATLPPLLDLLGFSPTTKNYILGVTFNALRLVSDFFITGKFLDDIAFEAFFNAIRVSFDAAILTGFTGVKVHDNFNFFGVDKVLPLLNRANGYAPDFLRLSDLIGHSVQQQALYDPSTTMVQVLSKLSDADDVQHDKAVRKLALMSVLNSLGGLIRGGAGVLELQGAAAGKFSAISQGATLQLGKFQQALQNIFTGVKTQGGKLLGTAASRLQPALMLEFFAQALITVVQQAGSAVFIPVIIKTGDDNVPFVPASVSETPALSLAPTIAASAVAPAAVASTPVAAAPVASSDVATYLVDLTQLSKLVKTKNLDAITAFYPQFGIDEHALLSSNFVNLYNTAAAVNSQLTTAGKKQLTKFSAALSAALNAVALARMQVDAWGYDPAAASTSTVLSQIAAAKSAVSSAASAATSLRAAIAGIGIPVTLIIEPTAVPESVNTTEAQTLTLTITNIGAQASEAGTIDFQNENGLLSVVGSSQQALPSLAAGESTTITWQVLSLSSDPQTDLSAVYQINILAGLTQASLTDELTLG